MSITITASNVAELKQLLWEMFPERLEVEKSVPAPKTQAPAPKTQAPAPEPAPAPKTQAPAPKTQAPASKTQAPAPKAGLTYEEVLNRVKSMKASTHPDVIKQVRAWKEENTKPDLKDMDSQGLQEVMEFLDTLEA